MVASFSVVLVLYVVEALTWTWWWWLAAALFAGFLVLTLTAPARLERRLAALGAGGSGAGHPRLR